MLIYFTLLITGLTAGIIDSIAGGGGLISLPVLFYFLGPGVEAIGTNKVSGAFGAFVALVVYSRQGHLRWKPSLIFTYAVVVGAWCGSQLSPYFPAIVFRWLLGLTCPLLLWIVWKKELLSKERLTSASPYWIAASGLLCGIYDGIWGPGGGTLMFLALTFFAKLPLLAAITASKLANTSSALIALSNYAAGGYVHWVEGFFLAAGMATGALIGSRYASKHAARIVRPVLTVVVTLLLFKVLFF